MARVWLGDDREQAPTSPEPPGPGWWVWLALLVATALLLLSVAGPESGPPLCQDHVRQLVFEDAGFRVTGDNGLIGPEQPAR